MPVVEFLPAETRVEVERGLTILEAVRLLGGGLCDWGVVSACGGQGTCGRCQVRVEGPVSDAGAEELELMARRGSGPPFRLACRTAIHGDVRVTLRRVRGGERLQSAGQLRPVTSDPAVRQVSFSLPVPGVGEKRGDAERLAAELSRLARAAERACGRPGPALAGARTLTFDYALSRRLSGLLWRQGFQGIAILRDDEVIDVRTPTSAGDAHVLAGVSGGAPAALLGLAFDLGTTKIAGYLVDLERGEILRAAARLNPQIPLGEDIVTRLGYAVQSEENYRRIRAAAAAGLNELAAELCAGIGRDPVEIEDTVIGGNTAMHHLLLGLDVGHLSRAPHVPSFSGPVDVKARDLGLRLAAGSYVHLLPCVAGYVGGDHVAVLLSTDLAAEPGVVLAIDVGTNTEIALSNRGKVVCCSCASGPAFEGGHVSSGMRALRGAIDKVWPAEEGLAYSVVGGGRPMGFCGAGVADLLAALLGTGALDRRGRLRAGLPGVEDAPGGRRFSLGGVALTQADIRELQLAKAAVRSGIEGLLRAEGLEADDIETVYLAGAFGVALSPVSAMAIGMFPRLPDERFLQVGNASGMGACLALISREMRREAARLAAEAGYLELACLPGYQELYLSCLGFPETADASP